MKKITFNHNAKTLFGSIGIDPTDNPDFISGISEWVDKFYFESLEGGQLFVSKVIEKILNHWSEDQAYQIAAISYFYRGISTYLEPVVFTPPTLID